MTGNTTLILHGWDGSRDALALARTLAGDPRFGKDLKVAVVGRSVAAEWEPDLSALGYRVVTTGDSATPGQQKNAGLEWVEGDVLFISALLQLPGEPWLDRLLEELQTAGGEGVAGYKVTDERGLIDNAGYHILRPDFRLFPLGGGKRDINQYYYPREIEGVDSSCMLVSRKAVEAAVGFDESFVAGYEDVDYCLKVRRSGMPVLAIGGADIVKRAAASESSAVGSQAEDECRDGFRSRWDAYYRERYDTRVMWHSWINAPTGYAVSSQYLVLALESLAVDVRYGFVYGVEEPPNEDERIMEVRRKPKDLDVTQVVYGQGDVFFKNSGKYRIGYSMLEVTGIPADWVEQANALDEVWVPSHFNEETFRSSGVRKPIKIMPLGVDTNYFHPYIESRRQGDRFVFLSVFEWGERKAPEILLQAYNQEFSAEDDVLLLLKVGNTDPALNIERQIEAMRLRADRAPVVVVLNQSVPSYQMGSLYCSSDCFVLPTRGEGWGMPTLEAMACGLPTISTPWSAQTEFFNEEVGYPIEISGLIPAVAKCPYYEGFEWANPDVDSLAYLMRYVYEHPDEARAKGMRASIWARDNWTWLDAAKRIKTRLLEISG